MTNNSNMTLLCFNNLTIEYDKRKISPIKILLAKCIVDYIGPIISALVVIVIACTMLNILSACKFSIITATVLSGLMSILVFILMALLWAKIYFILFPLKYQLINFLTDYEYDNIYVNRKGLFIFDILAEDEDGFCERSIYEFLPKNYIMRILTENDSIHMKIDLEEYIPIVTIMDQQSDELVIGGE